MAKWYGVPVRHKKNRRDKFNTDKVVTDIKATMQGMSAACYPDSAWQVRTVWKDCMIIVVSECRCGILA